MLDGYVQFVTASNIGFINERNKLMADKTIYEKGYWTRNHILAAEGKTYFEKTDAEIMASGIVKPPPTLAEIKEMLKLAKENESNS